MLYSSTMYRARPALLATTTALLAATSAAAPAAACTCPYMPRLYTLPSSGTIPANASGFFGGAWLQFGRATATEVIPLEFTTRMATDGWVELLPTMPLEAGARYQLRSETVINTFSAGAAAAIPTSLGVANASSPIVGPLGISTARGSCGITVTAAYADIALELSAEAMPWRELWFYTTEVDGVPFGAALHICQTIPPGESWVGRARDRVYAICRGDLDPSVPRGVSAGRHSVRFRGRLPGTTVDLLSDAAEIHLECPEEPDAGTPGDASADGDAGLPTKAGGCSASNVPLAPRGSLLTAALLLVLAFTARRRERARESGAR